jgi:amino acid transporter
MRADYGLYFLGIICFIIAGLVSLGTVPQYLPEPTTFGATAMTVIFTALGLIFAILGYALRPKPIISIPEAPKPAPPPSEETAEAQLSAPTPSTPPQEETVKPEREKPKAKTRRKRRKKT